MNIINSDPATLTNAIHLRESSEASTHCLESKVVSRMGSFTPQPVHSTPIKEILDQSPQVCDKYLN